VRSPIATSCIMDDSNEPQVESGASSHVSQSHQKNQVPYCHIIAPLLLFDEVLLLCIAF
jgi:hypothetical protein